MKYNKRISIVYCLCISNFPYILMFVSSNVLDSCPRSKFTSVTD